MQTGELTKICDIYQLIGGKSENIDNICDICQIGENIDLLPKRVTRFINC